MAFRERIEAVLRVKDANRFKSGMESAARSVRKFGKDEEAAAAQSELLNAILEKLDNQTVELAGAMRILASSVDEVGDEMASTTAKAAVFNATMKRSGTNAVFMGKSWAFWKDRLSLTRSEIVTTGLTISAWFIPAIIAMGSSFANAAIGGGAVAAGGLSSMIFGLGLMATLIKPLTDDIDKITKAQDQYNLAVEQYGAASSQASRASAHLGAVIRTQGGKDALKAVTAVERLKKTWASMTKPGQKSILDILLGGTGAVRSVMPSLAGMTNRMASSLAAALQPAFRAFTGPDIQKGLGALGRIFTRSIGPGVQGAVNLLTVFARIVRASAPWVVRWAKSWERVTDSWVDSTADQKKVGKFFKSAVRSFKLWWGLAKQLGRTLKIVFGASKSEGDKVVTVLTNLVRGFNDWLAAASSTGKIDEFWRKYNKAVSDAIWAVQHPIQAINRWLPQVMDAIATTLASHGPAAAWLFLEAFMSSNAWVHFFGVAVLLKKFGVFRAIGSTAGSLFVGTFLKSFIATAFPGMTAFFAVEGRLGAAIAASGRAIGKNFGKLFVAGVVAGIVLFGDDIVEALAKKLGAKHPEDFGPIGNAKDMLEKVAPWNWHIPRPGMPGGAMGGVLPMGASAFVGERGPEVAEATSHGTRIRPLSGNSRHTLPGMLDMPSLENAFHFYIETAVNVDRREIARAYNTEQAFVTARRGGRPPRTQVW